MLNEITQEYSSKKTSINKFKLPRIYNLVKNIDGFKKDTTNLDIGGGRFDNMTESLLSNFNISNLIYDPYNRSEMHNHNTLMHIKVKGADSVTCSNVLNVIKEREIRSKIYLIAHSALCIGSFAYFTVYEGNKSSIGKQTGKDQYQTNMRIKDYIPEISEIFESIEIRNGLIIAQRLS